MRRQDFAYHLPTDLIAQEPLAERSAARMLVLDAPTAAITDRTVRDLPEYLRRGDLLIVNDTRVIAARLSGTKPSGGRFHERCRHILRDFAALYFLLPLDARVAELVDAADSVEQLEPPWRNPRGEARQTR